jgi:putative hemolysin
MRDMFMLVDPFRGENSAAGNVGPLRQAMRWVEDGHMLAVFPAGEVAHADLKQMQIAESPWSPTIARIAGRAGAPVLPVFFTGCNSLAFQLMGLTHPLMRTAMLPREVFSHRGHCIEVRVGSLITQRKLAAFGDDAQVTQILRQRTLLLAHRTSNEPARESKSQSPVSLNEEVIPAVAVEALSADLANLPPKQLLVDGPDLVLYSAKAEQIPSILREIGRLREITYRATGEGTGRSIDLDRFDEWYTHLFIWSKAGNQIVGAYRLASTEETVAAHGTKGLYTSTLFNYRPGFIERLGPAIELGRSFIRAEYQRGFAPLLILWKGISQCVLARPDCKTLFGPVSISNDYRSVSKHVMIKFLEAAHGSADLKQLATPKSPFRPAGIDRLKSEPGLDRLLENGDIVDDLVADLEPDGKGLPVLIRQYLKLGAKFFSFNVDSNFNGAIDALMVVDLTQTDPKVLQRYMGVDGCAKFRAHHGEPPPKPSPAWRRNTEPALH